MVFPSADDGTPCATDMGPAACVGDDCIASLSSGCGAALTACNDDF